MALYKEVQSQYDQGLQIPEDVTLLFADDNFGSIRRLPTEQESRRKGGAGVITSFVEMCFFRVTYAYRFTITWSMSVIPVVTNG
jgi:hypothetical protein